MNTLENTGPKASEIHWPHLPMIFNDFPSLPMASHGNLPGPMPSQWIRCQLRRWKQSQRSQRQKLQQHQSHRHEIDRFCVFYDYSMQRYQIGSNQFKRFKDEPDCHKLPKYLYPCCIIKKGCWRIASPVLSRCARLEDDWQCNLPALAVGPSACLSMILIP